MIACKPQVLFASSVLVLLSACTIQGSPTPSADDPNTRVDEIVVVGTNVTSSLYTTGDLGLTTVPKDDKDEAVLAKGLAVHVAITSPIALSVDVAATDCTEPEDKKAIAVGVILDDSGSMGSNDPTLMRKDATISFLNTLGPEDKVLLTDYGMTGDDLRDLLCVQNASTAAPESVCSPPKPAFSADKAALVRATSQIGDGGGTPLYEACAQMVPLVDGVRDMRRGMLLLSDGRPNSDLDRDRCHSAAKAAQIPVFTVGLGPAAEGDVNAEDDAVRVLRELSTDTGGSYASANDPTQLDRLFQNMGTALARGSCKTTAKVREAATKIVPGTKVKGEVSIGTKGAKASFEFIAPKP